MGPTGVGKGNERKQEKDSGIMKSGKERVGLPGWESRLAKRRIFNDGNCDNGEQRNAEG
jgi:hypothetical protein